MSIRTGATELTSRRTLDSRVWENPDGSHTVEFGLDMHREVSPGNLQPVDSNFAQVSANEWVAQRSRNTIRMYRQAGANWVEVAHRESGKGARFQVPLSATVQDNYVEFIQSGLTWRYYVTNLGVKLISSAIQSPLGARPYNFTVQPLGGAVLAGSANAKGGLDGDNFLIPRPVAYCADDVVRELSAWSRSGATASFSVDDSAFPPEAYPYTIDPTTVFSVGVGADDTLIRGGSNAAYEGQAYLDHINNATSFDPCKHYNGAGLYWSNLVGLKWDTSGLPNDAEITGATLQIEALDTGANTDARNLVGSWDPWDGTSSDWSLDPSSDAFSVAMSTIVGSTGLKTIPLDTVTGVSKTGSTYITIGISGGTPTLWNGITLASYEHTTAQEPRLFVDYTSASVETLRPTGVSGLSNLTGSATDIDQDPNGTITDAGLVGVDPSNTLQTITFEGSADNPGNPTTSTSISIPITVNDNDIIIVTVVNGDGEAQPTISDNSGVNNWTDDINGGVVRHHAGNAMAGTVFWKRITNQAVERSKTVSLSGTTGSTCANLSVRRGCVTSGSPVDGTPVSESNASGNNTQAGITTLTDGASVHLAIFYSDNTNSTSGYTATDPATLTEGNEITSSGGTDSGLAIAREIKPTAGATGNFSWSPGTNQKSVSIAFALKPAGSPAQTINTQADVAMDDPVGTLSTGAGTGVITARLRKKGNGSNPQGRIEVRNAAGTLLDTVVPDTTITESDADGQLVSGQFNQSIILSKTDVVLRMVGTGAFGGLTELVAIEWDAQVVVTLQNVVLVGAVGIAGQL